jgi:hypothetical protein
MKKILSRPLRILGICTGPASEAVLVLPVGRLQRSRLGGALRVLEEVRPGVEAVVAQELEGRAVIVVGAAARGNVDLPGGAAELGRVDSGLHLEFLERLHRGQHDEQVEVDVRIRDAVERVVAPGRAGAGERHRQLGAGAALPAGRLRGLVESEGHVGAQRDQTEEVASVERQVGDAPLLDDGADGGVLGRQQRNRAGHLDGFAHLADFQREVDARRLLHLQLDARARRHFEALTLGLDFVHARNQRRDGVDARLVAGGHTNAVGGRVANGDVGAGDDRAGRVFDLAGDGGERLCAGRAGQQRGGQGSQYNPAT